MILESAVAEDAELDKMRELTLMFCTARRWNLGRGNEGNEQWNRVTVGRMRIGI